MGSFAEQDRSFEVLGEAHNSLGDVDGVEAGAESMCRSLQARAGITTYGRPKGFPGFLTSQHGHLSGGQGGFESGDYDEDHHSM